MNKIDPRIEKVLVTQDQIEVATTKLAKWIDKNYKGKNPVCVAVLKGAIPFYASVLMKTTIDLTTDFIVYSSFQGQVRRMKCPRMITDLKTDIYGRHVIVFDDVIDSGLTIKSMFDIFKTRKPKSLKLVTLVDKPEKRVAKINADYSCFKLPDYFLVGYGLDYMEKMRNINYIGVFKKELFLKGLERIEKEEKELKKIKIKKIKEKSIPKEGK